jgi:hypothetical protein
MGEIPYFMMGNTVFWDDSNPLKRSPEKMLKDVRNGFICIAFRSTVKI